MIGGLSREFYQRLKVHYDQPAAWRQQQPAEYRLYRPDDDAMWVFEPHVAEQTYDAWIAELQIPVVRDAWLDTRTARALYLNAVTRGPTTSSRQQQFLVRPRTGCGRSPTNPSPVNSARSSLSSPETPPGDSGTARSGARRTPFP